MIKYKKENSYALLAVFAAVFLLSGCGNSKNNAEVKNQINEQSEVKQDVPKESESIKEEAKEIESAGEDSEKAESQIISFENGSNEIDLNSDGIQDIVFKSFRHNGVSPHSYNVYNFFINKPASEYGTANWVIVQIDKEKNDKDAIDIDYDNDVPTREGAEIVLRDIRIIKTNDKKCFLVIADRDFGEIFPNDEIVSFDIYELKQNTTMDYDPDYYFNYLKSISAKDKYTDVNYAMDKELAIIFRESMNSI
ncbi:MAG: hypothetical protein NT170_03735 [Candidatus Moranbacteria bacterium]|nr:hypothetical protein [Candidatus Moranbacteria bacterium]